MQSLKVIMLKSFKLVFSSVFITIHHYPDILKIIEDEEKKASVGQC